MAVNKVVKNDGTTIIDISDTTATEDTIMKGFGAYGANGQWINGKATASADIDDDGNLQWVHDGDIDLNILSNHTHDSSEIEDFQNAVDGILEQKGYLTQHQDISGKLDKSGGTMTGALVAQTNTDYTTRQLRNVIISDSAPATSDGQNGDIWIVYE